LNSQDLNTVVQAFEKVEDLIKKADDDLDRDYAEAETDMKKGLTILDSPEPEIKLGSAQLATFETKSPAKSIKNSVIKREIS
jgi:hypothetical protein